MPPKRKREENKTQVDRKKCCIYIVAQQLSYPSEAQPTAPQMGMPMPQPGFTAQSMPPYPGNVQSPPPNYTQSQNPYPNMPPGFQPAYQQQPVAPYTSQPGPPPGQQVVMQQPGGMQQPGPPGAPQWMMQPQRPLNCPMGLEYLTMVDQLLVHQKVELLEGK